MRILFENVVDHLVFDYPLRESLGREELCKVEAILLAFLMSLVYGIEDFFLDVLKFLHTFNSLFKVWADEKSLGNLKLVGLSYLELVHISCEAFEVGHQVYENSKIFLIYGFKLLI